MGHEIFINIAGIIIKITGDRPPQKSGLERYLRYKPFILSRYAKKVDIDLMLSIRPCYKKFKSKILFDSSRGNPSEWRAGKIGKRILIEGEDSMVHAPYQVLLSADFKKGEIFIVNSEGRWVMESVIYGFLLVVVIYYLARHALGAVFHGSAVQYDKEGYLFAGLSGAGKSTISKLWAGVPKAKVLNDDKVIVRKESGIFYMYSTPWHGTYSEYFDQKPVLKTRLSKLFYLHHAKINRARKMSFPEDVCEFFSVIFMSFWDAKCLHFISGSVLDVCSSVPVYKLGFENNKKITGFIRKLP